MREKANIYVLEGSEENFLIPLNQEEQSFDLQIQGITINCCFPNERWEHGEIIL